MFRPIGRGVASFLAALAVASGALAAPDLTGQFSIGNSTGTDHKPQSKLWFNDGTWWAIVGGGTDQRIWKLDGSAFVAQTYPDAIVDSRTTARADVLWDGTYLYVLVWHDVTPRFVKYSYDSSTQTYSRLPGFPVSLPLSGTEVLVFDRDSTGRLWASYELGNSIHAIWTTTPDHLSWNLTGTVLETNVDSDDITTTVAFGGDRIGVLWSDQSADATWQFGFRWHRDTDPPDVWQPLEVVDTGSAVDDHINMKAAADGRLFLTAKDLYNHIQLYVRGTAGGWQRVASNLNQGSCTRPIVQLDEAQGLVHVFYTDWITSPNPILSVSAPLSTLAFGAPEPFLSGATAQLNDVTGTKQRLSARTGILAMASASNDAYWGFTSLDTDSPLAAAIDPADDAVGIALQPLVQIRLTDAGMGVRRSSIQMTVDGAPVSPGIVGSATQYLLTWTPSTPFDNGRIYTLNVSAQDYAYPPHSATTSLRFRTEMLPGPLDKKIDFQPSTGATAPGYEAESGQSWTLDRGRGWDKTMTLKRANLNADLRLDTYVERKNSSSRATWAYDLANGLYRITFAAGAPDAGGKQRIEVEGELLLNNQVTTAGQFLTIADYPVAVRDGKLEVKIGGASGSTKTQLCFFEFRYDGPAPPPPPPPSPSTPPPMPVANLAVTRATNDIRLAWSPVTTDTTGALIAVTRYHVYRGASPGFRPDKSGHTNRVGVVTAASFTDLGAATAAGDLYYLVTAEGTSGLESTRASNLGVRRRLRLTPPTGAPTSAWVSMPRTTGLAAAADLVTLWNGGAGAGPVVALARVDRETQVRQVWSYAGGRWTGTDFPIVPGDAIEVTAGASLDVLLTGAEDTNPAYGFAFHTQVGNLSWISLPQDVAYADAHAVVQAMNGGTGPGPITRVAWLDPASGQMQSWLWFAGAWRGTNFALQPGHGLAVLAGGDLPSWIPARLPH